MNCMYNFVYIAGGVHKIQLFTVALCELGHSDRSVSKHSLMHTECFATTPKASQNKQLFITGETILKPCLSLPILAHSMWPLHTCVFFYDVEIFIIK